MKEYFDSTLLKADATAEQIAVLCHEAMDYDFKAVCIPPCYVAMAHDLLKNSGVKIATVIGFPLGNQTMATKVFETRDAVEHGADEIDMVMNISAFKSGRRMEVLDDIRGVVEAAGQGDAIVKVILETCLLTDAEIQAACELVLETDAAFVKTSTGFSTGGATPEAVRIMKDAVGGRLQVKAAGGIRTLADAKAMIEAGADRLGCSAAAAIMEEWKTVSAR